MNVITDANVRAVKMSTLKDGILHVSNMSKEDIQKLRRHMRLDLLDQLIPHYRPIGINLGGVGKIDFITKISGADKSYAELLISLRDLVFADDNRFDGQNNKQFKLNARQYGLFGCYSRLGALSALGGQITSSNGGLFYSGVGISESAEALVEDIDICNIYGDAVTFDLILLRSVGMVDFSIAGLLLEGSGFVPIRAVYDLNNILCISDYTDDSESSDIKFMYKKPVNENVLKKIIDSYVMERGIDIWE